MLICERVVMLRLVQPVPAFPEEYTRHKKCREWISPPPAKQTIHEQPKQCDGSKSRTDRRAGPRPVP
jgi:hypothetical protein